MTQYNRPPGGHDCPPAPETRADQPKAPGDSCVALPTTEPPELEEPAKCPDPDPDCNCPNKPGPSSNCIEDLIAKQAADIAAAEKAKVFKTDLEGLLAKAKAADQAYTRDKYDALVKAWVKNDTDLAELIRRVTCAVPCWRCIIDCHVCPLLNELHYAEARLYGDGTLPADVHNLYDLQYWYSRDKDAKARTLQRIRDVLTAWEKPAQTIEKAINDVKTGIEAAGKSHGNGVGKVVYDVFLRLVPLHLAIAPPAATAKTGIGQEHTVFCGCDTGTPDDCCGPDVGVPTLRQRLIGPQPYLIDPHAYLDLICCLVENRYGPAKEELAKAEADATAVDNQIARAKARLGNWTTTFDDLAKGSIPSLIDCCQYEKGETDPKPAEAR